MDTLDVLFSYLRDALYDTQNAVLNIERLPKEFQEFGKGLHYFVQCVVEAKIMARALSKGDLAEKATSRGNEVAAPLKSLHASLKHLTWQTQQIAQGDYRQRVEFMGEFSVAFNTMIEQLEERQKKLEDKIGRIQQGNILLSSLMRKVPLQIFVVDQDTKEVLLMNDIVASEVNKDPLYIENLIQIVNDSVGDDLHNSQDIEFSYFREGVKCTYMVSVYLLEWDKSNSKVFVINDVSSTKSKIEELEIHAFHDSFTQLYNRAFGMRMLDTWIYAKSKFVLVFTDLDNLKYINDEFGHNEGDTYIKNAAKHLKTFSPDAIVCRIGGDEFMLLMIDIDYEDAYDKMNTVSENLRRDDYLSDKLYSYNISFGIVFVEAENELSAGDILSIADERMYENKRKKKKTAQRYN